MTDEPVTPDTVDLVAAALRADARDISSLVRVLAGTLPEMLPESMVEVDRSRSLADRVAGRTGAVRGVTVVLRERVLELRAGDGGAPTAEVRHVVRGIVISRQQVGLDQWVRLLAGELAELADESAAARAALSALLGQG